MADRRYFTAQFTQGEVSIYLPEVMTHGDCDDLEEYFSLILRQCKRRAATVSETSNVIPSP